MTLGAADFAASMGMVTTGISGTQGEYYTHHAGEKCWSKPWHWFRPSWLQLVALMEYYQKMGPMVIFVAVRFFC